MLKDQIKKKINYTKGFKKISIKRMRVEIKIKNKNNFFIKGKN
jgi:hypothetical protein